MNPLLIDFLAALIRFVLSSLGAWFVAKGILTAEQTGQYIAFLTSAAFIVPAAASLVSFGWSLYAKFKARQKQLTAQASPVPMTEAQVDAKVKAGAAPSVSTPVTEVPVSPPTTKK